MIAFARILILMFGFGLSLVLAISAYLNRDLSLALKATAAVAVASALYRQLSQASTSRGATEPTKAERKIISKRMIFGVFMGLTVPMSVAALMVWWIGKQ